MPETVDFFDWEVVVDFEDSEVGYFETWAIQARKLTKIWVNESDFNIAHLNIRIILDPESLSILTNVMLSSFVLQRNGRRLDAIWVTDDYIIR